MKRINRRSFTVAICIGVCFLLSCKKRLVTKEQLVNYVRTNHTLTQSIEVNGVITEISFVPYQLMVMQELGDGNPMDSAHIAPLDKKYKGQYYFRISFSKNNKEVIRQLDDFQAYSQMVQLLSFRLDNYINATGVADEAIAVEEYAFERNYGLANANRVMIVFKKEDFSRSDQIPIVVKELGFGTGTLHFRFNRKNLDNIPFGYQGKD